MSKQRCARCLKRPIYVDRWCEPCLRAGKANKFPPVPTPEKVHISDFKFDLDRSFNNKFRDKKSHGRF